jgi:hypothetical protein
MRTILAVLACLAVATSAFAADYTFEWDASPAAENGVKYQLKKNGNVVDSPTTTQSKPIPASPGDKFTVAAVNDQGTSSEDSEPVTINGAPTAPGKVRVKITVIVESNP